MNFFLYLELPPAAPTQAARSGPVLRNLAEGLAYVFRSPVILGVLAITTIMNLLGFPYQNMVPVIARQILELGPQLAGLLLASDGLGAFVGSLLVASRRSVRRRGLLFALGSFAMMGSVFLFSFSRWYPLSCLLLFCAGVGTACFATMQSSLVLTTASDAMRGRAMGTLMLAIGFGPIGALQIGALAAGLGASLAVSVSTGTGIALLAVIVWKATALRRLHTDMARTHAG
jgi:MFS family permease